jgi:hypothetical protein
VVSRAAFQKFLSAQIGKDYGWGDEGPDTFDCSGLTQAAYESVGIQIPRVARDQQAFTTRVDKPQFGDLVFFGQPAHHVGVYVAPGIMEDAPDVGKKIGLEHIGNNFTNYGRVPGITWDGKTTGAGTSIEPPLKDQTPIGSWAEGLTHVLAALVNPNTWLRIGETVLGLLLIAVGTAKLTRAVPIAHKVARAIS